MDEHLTSAEAMRRSPLRRWRLQNGLSLEEVAELTGVTASHLSRVERGLKGMAPLTRVRIARRLGARVSDLFDVEPLEDVEVAS